MTDFYGWESVFSLFTFYCNLPRILLSHVIRKPKKWSLPSVYLLIDRFFTENPSYQQNFKSFKDVPISELSGNKKLLAHAISVLYAVTSLVDNLDDPETLVEMLSKVGQNHSRRHINLEMFQNLGVSIVGLLIQKLGPQVMDSVAIDAWKKTYGVILSVIQKDLEPGVTSST